jgi:hypothetical protein
MAIIEMIDKATLAPLPRRTRSNTMGKTTSTRALAHIVLDRRPSFRRAAVIPAWKS